MFSFGRVRIINVSGIVFGHKHWDNGDEVQVISNTADSLLVESRKQVGTYVITSAELNCVEFIDWELPEKLEDIYAGGNSNMAPKKKVTIVTKKSKDSQARALKLEQDYWLASLYNSMQAQDDAGRISANAELTRIHAELEALK